MMAKAAVLQDQMIGWQCTIHQHPELSFTEIKTARLVTSVLHDLGIEAEIKLIDLPRLASGLNMGVFQMS